MKAYSFPKACVLVAFAAVLVYVNAVPNGFTLDDEHAVVNNPVIKTSDFFLRVWQTDYWGPDKMNGRYRPLTSITFGLNYHLFGLNPRAYHLTNVLFHALTSLLVLLLSQFLTGRLGIPASFALVSGLVFAVHPISTEAVAGIAGRAEIMMAAFYLAGLYFGLAYLGFWENGRGRCFNLCMGLAAYCLSLACKENGVSLPLAMLLFWYALRNGGTDEPRQWRDLLRHWPMFLGLALVLGLYLTCRFHLFGVLGARGSGFESNPIFDAAAPTRMVTALYLLGRYLYLLVFPLSLSCEYSYNQIPAITGLADPRNLVTAALLLTGVALVKWRRSLPLIFLGFFFALAALLPVSNVLFPIGSIFAERLLYLPCFGLALAVGQAIYLGAAAVGRRSRVVWLAFAILLLMAGVRTVLRNADWRNNFSLFTSGTRVAPNSARMHLNLANELRRRKRVEDALEEAERSLSIYPGSANAYLVRGRLLMTLGRLEEARAEFARGEALDPELEVAPLFLGNVLEALGRIKEAESAWRRAIAKGLTWSDPWKNLARIYMKRDPPRAIRCLGRAVETEPHDPDAWLALSVALYEQGRPSESADALEKAHAFFPDNVQIQFNLGLVYIRLGENVSSGRSLLRKAYPRSPPEIQAQIRRLLGE